MVLNNYRKLIGDLTILASVELDEVVVMTNLLTLDFKLALLVVILEVNEEADDAREKHRSDGSASNARRFKHHSRSGG